MTISGLSDGADLIVDDFASADGRYALTDRNYSVIGVTGDSVDDTQHNDALVSLENRIRSSACGTPRRMGRRRRRLRCIRGIFNRGTVEAICI